MFTRLELRNFKSFRAAELPLAPFTVLVGTNAAGKSNLRDALRFIHGVGRGYSLPEVLGGRWSDAAVREWSGVRGGAADVVTRGETELGVAVSVADGDETELRYPLHVRIDTKSFEPVISLESVEGVFESRNGHVEFDAPEYFLDFDVDVDDDGNRVPYAASDPDAWYSPIEPVLPRIEGSGTIGMQTRTGPLLDGLRGIRFLDPAPSVMREPSPAGVRVLGDHGENLASVLERICATPSGRDVLVGWLRQLTPTDVSDVRFSRVYGGKTAFELVESSGALTSMASASDGTLRFLALLASMFNDEGPPPCLVVEEIDAGIHPTRLQLLVELIEQRCHEGHAQVIATTHSPFLLTLLSQRSRDAALLVYRRAGRSGSAVRRVVDLPGARDVLARQDLARLHASGWMENVAAFADVPPDSAEPQV